MNKTTLTKKIMKPILAVVGPAAVMTAGVMGSGSTTSLILSGTYFGYSLLWVAVYTIPILVIIQDSASRIGVMSGNKGMFTIMDEQIHPLLKWFFLFPIIILAFVANMGQTKVMVSSVLTILGAYNPVYGIIILTTVVVVIGVWLTVIFGGYKRIEKIMTGVLFFMALAFLLVSLKGFEKPLEILKGLVPNIPPNDGGRNSLQFISAITGASIAITAILAFPYFTAEGGYKKQDVSANFKKAVLTFGLIRGIWCIAALVAGASVLFVLSNHLKIENISQAGQILGPILGNWGVVIFSLGLFGSAYATFIVVAQLLTYFTLDAFKKDWRFDIKNKRFIVLFSIFLFLPGLTSFLWNIPALLSIVAAMMLSVFGTPITIIIVIYLMNKKNFIGENKASIARNTILAVGFILTFMLAYYQIVQFIK